MCVSAVVVNGLYRLLRGCHLLVDLGCQGCMAKVLVQQYLSMLVAALRGTGTVAE
jgi:hypothetical protein